MATRPDDEKPGPASDSQLAEMQAAFEEQLANFEQQLSKHEGPFILGCTSHLQQCFAVGLFWAVCRPSHFTVLHHCLCGWYLFWCTLFLQAPASLTVANACREFSLVDIVYAPALERLAANLPVMRGFKLRDHPDYPHSAAWFHALDQRPAYQKVKSDDVTHNQVFK